MFRMNGMPWVHGCTRAAMLGMNRKFITHELLICSDKMHHPANHAISTVVILKVDFCKTLINPTTYLLVNLPVKFSSTQSK